MQNKLVDKLVEECSENIDGNEMICNGNLNDKKYAILAQYTQYYLSLLF